MGIFSKEEGWDCERNPDGSQSCRRFRVDGEGNKIATGSEINMVADDNCDVVLSGDVNTIMDKDQKKIARMSEMVKKGCRRGHA